MDEHVSLGDRLDVVAYVCAAATTLVLVANLVNALTMNLTVGATMSAWQQRLLGWADAADLTLALVVVVGAASLAMRRWLAGDHATGSDGVGVLVVGAAIAVTTLAIVDMFGEALWRLQGAQWGWRFRSIGEHVAIAAIALVGWWLARPPRQRSR